ANNGNDLGTAITWMALVRQTQPEGDPDAESLYRAAMASEDAESPELALTLEFYRQFLKARDRAVEAGPLESRAKGIRKARIQAMGPRIELTTPAYKMGGEVKAPKLLFKLEPEYSEEARAAKLQGSVVLKVVVDVDG